MAKLNQLKTWLFTPPMEPRTVRSVIAWWEKRRLFYNLFIGSIGICSFVFFMVSVWQADILLPGEDAVEPLAVIFAPIPINICYTFGWIVEAWSIRKGKGSSLIYGPRLLKMGLAFSLFVVLLPSVIWGLIWAGILLPDRERGVSKYNTVGCIGHTL
jgi:hypothetical protein